MVSGTRDNPPLETTLPVREDTSSGRNENNCSTSRNVIDQNIGSHFITIFSAAKFKMADKWEESTYEFFFNFVPQSFFFVVFAAMKS